MDQNGFKWNICYNIRVLNDDGLLNLHGLIYLDFMEMNYIICVFEIKVHDVGNGIHDRLIFVI